MADFAILEKLRRETQSRPRDPHPSDLNPIEVQRPAKWAAEEFKELPVEVGDAVHSQKRSPLIPPSFGSRVTALERAYFSLANRDYIMERILAVMQRDHFVTLTRQSDTALLGLMTNVYHDTVRNLQRTDEDFLRVLIAVATLNAIVLERAIAIMLREWKDFKKDRQFWEKPVVPQIPLPKWTSIKNESPLSPLPTFTTKFAQRRPPGLVDGTVQGDPIDLAAVGTWP